MMNSNPLVSIIINNYNYVRFIRNAIDSAINQTYSNIEVIVVDDGSKDDSPKIIREYDNKIVTIFKQNGGQASAFNAGFDISNGDIIVFLDSDDALLPTTIERVVELFRDSKVVKVHWKLYIIDEIGKKTGRIIPHLTLAEGDFKKELIQYGPNNCGGPSHSPPTSGIAWFRHFLERVFPLSEEEFKTGGNDYYLSVLAPLFGELRSIPEPQGLYRIHGNNDTLKPIEEYIKGFFYWFEHTCFKLSQHLQNIGIEIDSSTWTRDSWYHQIHEALHEIISVIPIWNSFILIDGNSLRISDTIEGRYRIPFMEKNGQYCGEPADDESAIKEIDRQRENGVSFVVFAWPAFWYMDHYFKLNDYLRTQYKCVLESERLVVFDLQTKRETNLGN
ncbi:MAG: glycosyltransferase family 2 protein [Bacteroidia bacterium]|nr:glycosyltransferase family 2 protein [Bacteroidia bacterium]